MTIDPRNFRCLLSHRNRPAILRISAISFILALVAGCSRTPAITLLCPRSRDAVVEIISPRLVSAVHNRDDSDLMNSIAIGDQYFRTTITIENQGEAGTWQCLIKRRYKGGGGFMGYLAHTRQERTIRIDVRQVGFDTEITVLDPIPDGESLQVGRTIADELVPTIYP